MPPSRRRVVPAGLAPAPCPNRGADRWRGGHATVLLARRLIESTRPGRPSQGQTSRHPDLPRTRLGDPLASPPAPGLIIGHQLGQRYRHICQPAVTSIEDLHRSPRRARVRARVRSADSRPRRYSGPHSGSHSGSLGLALGLARARTRACGTCLAHPICHLVYVFAGPADYRCAR